MSDLNDLIARNAVMAFNSGYQTALAAERKRLTGIFVAIRDYDCTCKCDCHAHAAPCHSCVVNNELIEIINGDTNEQAS